MWPPCLSGSLVLRLLKDNCEIINVGYSRCALKSYFAPELLLSLLCKTSCFFSAGIKCLLKKKDQ